MYKETIIESGKMDPVPQIGDKLKENGRVWEIEACNCSYGNGDPNCGPHFICTDGGCKICMVYWHLDGGWSITVDGAIPIQGQEIVSICDLKAANTQPGITECVSCGAKLKDPIPGWNKMKYCPKCEA